MTVPYQRIEVDHHLVRSIDLFTQPGVHDERLRLGYDYLSASQMTGYARCGIAYYLQYGLGMREPASPAMVRGTALHAGLAAAFIARMNGAPITADAALEAAMTSLASEGAHLPDIERAAIAFDLERGLPVALDAYGTLPVEHVERGVAIHWHDPDVLPVVGYPDAVAPGGNIDDFKTSSKKKDPRSVRIDLGLTVYGTAHRLINKRDEVDVCLRAIIFHKHEVLTQDLLGTRDDRSTTTLFNFARTMTMNLRDGRYLPSLDPYHPFGCVKCGLYDACQNLTSKTATSEAA